MTRIRAIVVVTVLVLAGCFALLAVPGIRLTLRLNRLQYLVNDHRYLTAMTEWEKLARRWPETRRRRPDFEREIIRQAIGYYTSVPADSREGSDADLGAFLRLVAARPETAPLGRRLELNLSVKGDAPTTATLACARRILEHEGYDPQALWWVVRSQYDPRRPRQIPPEVRRYSDQLVQPPPSAPAGPHDFARNVYLRALLAMDERDWARAAHLFGICQAIGELRPVESLPLATALLRSGRADAAVAGLLRFLETAPNDVDGLALLLDAYLRLRETAWAAATMDRLRPLDSRVLRDTLSEFHGPLATRDPDPLIALANAAVTTGPLVAAAWHLADRAASTPAQRAAVDRAAVALIDAGPPTAAGQALLLGWCLRQRRADLADRLASGLADRPVGDNLAAATVRRAAATLLNPGTERGAGALATLPVNRLLTFNTTQHLELTLPAGASLLVAQVVGYPNGGVWPICRVDLGPYGAGDYYTAEPSGQGLPLTLALSWPIAETVTAPVAISLLNATAGEDRNLFLKQIDVF